MVDPLSYFPFQPVLHNWFILSCLWMVHIKDPLLLIENTGFLSSYLSGPLLSARCHITINKMFLVHH